MIFYITSFFIIIIFAVLITAFHSFDKKSKKTKSAKVLELRRSIKNPVLKPERGRGWESEAVFNPAAIKLGDKTHLLYRAIGSDGISRIGYSSSENGLDFEERLPYPVFAMENPRSDNFSGKRGYDFVSYPSGGSWGGCEDPRAVNIEGRIYVTFNAFDGWDFIRIGMTSIKESDLKNKRWNWTKPILISSKGEINKNWVIFPEKINGKFAILHSLSPEVQIDYVDNFESLANGTKKIKSLFNHKTPRKEWDTWVRGAGPPPLKTKDGWLIFYHAINKDEPNRYKLGIMLLDLKHPERIVARSPAPILLPDKWYENDLKPGVVYACGAILSKDKVYVYYGGGDKHVCVATAPLVEILDYLKKSGPKPKFATGVR